VFAGWVTARPESNAAEVEEAYLAELDRLAKEPVTEDELDRARALIEAGELGALGRVDEVADRLAMYATLFGRPQLINEQLERYLAVDAPAIRSVAAEVFRADNRAVLTFVPREAEEAAAA
jgi:predicted Zn-dependent peptidase